MNKHTALCVKQVKSSETFCHGCGSPQICGHVRLRLRNQGHGRTNRRLGYTDRRSGGQQDIVSRRSEGKRQAGKKVFDRHTLISRIRCREYRRPYPSVCRKTARTNPLPWPPPVTKSVLIAPTLAATLAEIYGTPRIHQSSKLGASLRNFPGFGTPNF